MKPAAHTGIAGALAVLLSAVALAVDTAAIDQDVSATLDRFYRLSGLSKGLEQYAAAILVFPRITKAGVGVGGEYGDGALLENGKTVGYYSISGASVGLTLGMSRHSQVILFNTTEARDMFLNDGNWSFGAHASIAVMRKDTGGIDSETLKKPVVAFVFGEKGLMGDASLQGAKITKIVQ